MRSTPTLAFISAVAIALSACGASEASIETGQASQSADANAGEDWSWVDTELDQAPSPDLERTLPVSPLAEVPMSKRMELFSCGELTERFGSAVLPSRPGLCFVERQLSETGAVRSVRIDGAVVPIGTIFAMEDGANVDVASVLDRTWEDVTADPNLGVWFALVGEQSWATSAKGIDAIRGDENAAVVDFPSVDFELGANRMTATEDPDGVIRVRWDVRQDDGSVVPVWASSGSVDVAPLLEALEQQS